MNNKTAATITPFKIEHGEPQNKPETNAVGYFGNIWIRENKLKGAGDTLPGHRHHFDHVSILVSGSVEVNVQGFEPSVFHAPAFIIIKKEHNHQFTALTDNVAWYCAFALRDENGELTDVYSGDNSPYGRKAVGNQPWLEAMTTFPTPPANQ